MKEIIAWLSRPRLFSAITAASACSRHMDNCSPVSSLSPAKGYNNCQSHHDLGWLSHSYLPPTVAHQTSWLQSDNDLCSYHLVATRTSSRMWPLPGIQRTKRYFVRLTCKFISSTSNIIIYLTTNFCPLLTFAGFLAWLWELWKGVLKEVVLKNSIVKDQNV